MYPAGQRFNGTISYYITGFVDDFADEFWLSADLGAANHAPAHFYFEFFRNVRRCGRVQTPKAPNQLRRSAGRSFAVRSPVWDCGEWLIIPDNGKFLRLSCFSPHTIGPKSAKTGVWDAYSYWIFISNRATLRVRIAHLVRAVQERLHQACDCPKINRLLTLKRDTCEAFLAGVSRLG